MTATLEQRRLGELDWIVVRGERGEVFEALGQHCAERIAAVVGTSELLPQLRTRAERSPHYAEVRERSRLDCAQQWAELQSLALGAGVDAEDLVLLNLRGDLGEDGTGCTDVAFRSGSEVVIAHNEDGSADFDCVMLTLVIDEDPAVSVFWYPGMLPANSFVITDTGLAWGCDAVQVDHPARAPGRHFIARAMQGASTIEELEEFLRSHRSAGGFAYAVGEWRGNRAAHLEAAAGQVSRVDLPTDLPVDLPTGSAATGGRNSGTPLLWHTNHLRQLEGLDRAGEESVTRGEVAADWEPTGSAVGWCLDSLAARGTSEGGVHRDAAPGAATSVTLGTLILECESGQLTIAPRGRPVVTRSVPELLG